MAKKKTELAEINDELNALDWDPPLRRVRVKHRNRFDVKFFFKDGASLHWLSNPSRALSAVEMVKSLREVIGAIEASTVERPRAVDEVDPSVDSTDDLPRA